MSLEPFDPATYFHRMAWEVRRLKATHTEFQRLFEEVMLRVEPERFTPVEPYGREGDWKADGLLDGGRVVFQVYSPNELKASEVKAKIADDLPGAVEHWNDVIEKWVFVYNRGRRQGVAPQIIGTLNDYVEEYPEVAVSHWSDTTLWDKLCELPPTDRTELLVPALHGWDGAFVPPSGDPDEYEDELANSRIVLLHPHDRPLDPDAVQEALAPEVPFGPPYPLEPNWKEGWGQAAAYQRDAVEELIQRAGDRIARFAVFSQAPIPLAIQFGSILSDRVDVDLYQYHRDRGEWRWDPEVDAREADDELRVRGLPDEPDATVEDVCVCFALSAIVSDEDLRDIRPDGAAEVEMRVDDPDPLWLRHPSQIDALRKSYRQLWKQIRRSFPSVERIHIFYAGPAPGAVGLGQSHNPRMEPPLLLYEYDRSSTPRYEHVLTIGD